MTCAVHCAALRSGERAWPCYLSSAGNSHCNLLTCSALLSRNLLTLLCPPAPQPAHLALPSCPQSAPLQASAPPSWRTRPTSSSPSATTAARRRCTCGPAPHASPSASAQKLAKWLTGSRAGTRPSVPHWRPRGPAARRGALRPDGVGRGAAEAGYSCAMRCLRSTSQCVVVTPMQRCSCV